MTSETDSIYERRKLDGKCTVCGEGARPDGQLCDEHQESEALRQRKSIKRIRKTRRSRGCCAMCGRKSKAYRCLKCKVNLKGSRSVSVAKGVAKLAARLERIRAQIVVGDDGRSRYHGQLRRGRQTVEALDEQDIDAAIRELLKAKDGLRLVRSPKNDGLPRIQRREAEHVAVGMAVLGARLIFDVARRNGMDVDVGDWVDSGDENE